MLSSRLLNEDEEKLNQLKTDSKAACGVILCCYCYAPIAYLACLPLLDIPLIISERRFKQQLSNNSNRSQANFFAPCTTINNMKKVKQELEAEIKAAPLAISM